MHCDRPTHVRWIVTSAVAPCIVLDAVTMASLFLCMSFIICDVWLLIRPLD